MDWRGEPVSISMQEASSISSASIGSKTSSRLAGVRDEKRSLVMTAMMNMITARLLTRKTSRCKVGETTVTSVTTRRWTGAQQNSRTPGTMTLEAEKSEAETLRSSSTMQPQATGASAARHLASAK